MFKVWEKYSSVILLGIILYLMLMYIKGCNAHNVDKTRIASLLEYKHIAKKYITKDSTVVNYNSSIAVTPEDLKIIQDTLLDYIENLEIKIKNVESTTIITERLKIDTLEVPVYLTNCEFDTTVQITDPYYDMDITLTNQGLTFNTIEFSNTVGITLAEKREKWFKKKESIVTVTHSNPYMQVDGISTYTFSQQKKWYNKWWVHTLSGVIVGGAIVYSVTK